MIRRLNYTQRRRIERQRVAMEIIDDGDGSPASFSAKKLDLQGMDLPPDARVIIEAKRDRFSRRFDWGTVGSPRPPSDALLSDMPPNPSFRVMVVSSDGTSRLLALADNIKPQRESAGPESLLWMELQDLGQEVWRLDFGDGNDNPTMFVNRNIPGISEAMRSDEALLSAIIPEALRSILTRALVIDECDAEDDSGQWSEWIAFARQFNSGEMPVSSDDAQADAAKKTEWINGAVAAFTAERFHASDKYKTAKTARS